MSRAGVWTLLLKHSLKKSIDLNSIQAKITMQRICDRPEDLRTKVFKCALTILHFQFKFLFYDHTPKCESIYRMEYTFFKEQTKMVKWFSWMTCSKMSPRWIFLTIPGNWWVGYLGTILLFDNTGWHNHNGVYRERIISK